MPQGHRRTAFSGKKKKEQLLAKRQSKVSKNQVYLKGRSKTTNCDSDDDESSTSSIQERLNRVQKLNNQPSRDNRSKPNRYALQFYRESEKELKALKEEAQHALNKLESNELESDYDYYANFDFPRRPSWDYSISKEELERNENRYFTQYISAIERTCDPKDLSYFELNLETWRQLWRVLEISDVVLIITDARFPNLMFPPSVYDYVTKDLGKEMILVLNKIDLVPANLVLAWKKYFRSKYSNLKIVMFTSCPSYNMRGNVVNQQGLMVRRRKGKPRMAAEGALQVLNVCREIVCNEVDLSSWEQKIVDDMNQDAVGGLEEDEDDELIAEETTKPEIDFNYVEHSKYDKGVLTIGCIGFPNVGKSSLLNALMGKKVVSVSRTPGHTKHFQTIFLTNNVRLCDCPGLVFPSSTPRKLQVLMGSYPVAQLREPYGSIRYLAERMDLTKLLNIKHTQDDNTWSPIDICESWALKRGFLTAKAGRPDTYRAANSILRMALDGKITLCVRPPNFSSSVESLNSDPELNEVLHIQALGKTEESDLKESDNLSSDDESKKNSDTDIDADDDNDSDDDEHEIPVTKNVFSLLNDD